MNLLNLVLFCLVVKGSFGAPVSEEHEDEKRFIKRQTPFCKHPKSYDVNNVNQHLLVTTDNNPSYITNDYIKHPENYYSTYLTYPYDLVQPQSNQVKEQRIRQPSILSKSNGNWQGYVNQFGLGNKNVQTTVVQNVGRRQNVPHTPQSYYYNYRLQTQYPNVNQIIVPKSITNGLIQVLPQNSHDDGNVKVSKGINDINANRQTNVEQLRRQNSNKKGIVDQTGFFNINAQQNSLYRRHGEPYELKATGVHQTGMGNINLQGIDSSSFSSTFPLTALDNQYTNIPRIPTMLDMPKIPGHSDMSTLPDLSSLTDFSRISDLMKLPELPKSPYMSTLPNMATLSSLSTAPTVQTLSTMLKN